MRYVAVILMAMFFAGGASAGQCPLLMGKIDKLLESAELDSATKAEIKELRDKGESLHSQGKHAESVQALEQAMSKLDAAS